jgi:hypothetical protein
MHGRLKTPCRHTCSCEDTQCFNGDDGSVLRIVEALGICLVASLAILRLILQHGATYAPAKNGNVVSTHGSLDKTHATARGVSMRRPHRHLAGVRAADIATLMLPDQIINAPGKRCRQRRQDLPSEDLCVREVRYLEQLYARCNFSRAVYFALNLSVHRLR